MKPVVWSQAAKRDTNETAHWHASQGGLSLAERFLTQMEATLDHISAHPQTGSTRHGMLLKIDELRFWPVNGFPYSVFYIERPARVDVWRVLHAQRDIPAWAAESG